MIQKFPIEGDIIVMKDYALVVIQNDWDKKEALMKICDSKEEAIQWLHDVSLKQAPEWHKGNCDRCKNDSEKISD